MSERYRDQKWLIALVALSPWFAASTCDDGFAPDDEAPSCVFDEECGEGTVCFRGTCTATCESDDDCGGLMCASQARSEADDVVDVCVDQSDDPIDMQCRLDADCAAAFPGTDARCGIDGTCYVPAFSLLIRDTSAPSDIDGGLGADIVAVYLEDPETGTPIAWADTIDESEGINNEPDGEPRALEGDPLCAVDEFSDVAASLGGAGGYLLVRFLEVDPRVEGQVVPTPPSSWNVVVVEWGANCGATEESDSYEVFACAAPTHKATDPTRHCPDQLGVASTGGVLRIAAEQK